ncbi:MAG: hypothetical protein V4542_05180 [Pseudomonadota bacterium]
MGLIPFLWCAFASVVLALAWVVLRLDCALKQEMLARELLAAELAVLHDIDIASRLRKLPDAPAALPPVPPPHLKALHF